ncbi:MAG: serine/threonine-protein phosphatase, partial [Nitrospira sp.]|nr:serine/threonine-protein phosphatase [Nitrospira sp.]
RDHLGLFMLDASGHGVSAALRAVAMSTFLHPGNISQVVGSFYPSAILAEANRRFQITERADYFTLWVGVLHLPTWVIRFASAGHAGALLCGPKHGPVGLSFDDLALGLDPDSIYKSGQRQMQPGDRLYMCSDGIYETLSPEQELWGLERLQQMVAQSAALPIDQVIEQCFQASRDWQRTETFGDDAALICLERLVS